MRINYATKGVNLTMQLHVASLVIFSCIYICAQTEKFAAFTMLCIDVANLLYFWLWLLYTPHPNGEKTALS